MLKTQMVEGGEEQEDKLEVDEMPRRTRITFRTSSGRRVSFSIKRRR